MKWLSDGMMSRATGTDCKRHILHNTFKVHMPLFFLLSGFCLTLGYGRTKYTRSAICCGRLACTDACNCCRPMRRDGAATDQQQSNGSVFDTNKFLFNRLAKILPVYYVCFIIAIALTPTGHNQVKIRKSVRRYTNGYQMDIL